MAKDFIHDARKLIIHQKKKVLKKSNQKIQNKMKASKHNTIAKEQNKKDIFSLVRFCSCFYNAHLV